MKSPEYLELKSGPFNVVRIAIGICSIISGVTLLAAFWNKMETVTLIAVILLAFSGTAYLTNSFGFGRSWIRRNEDSLTVKWINMMRPLQIHIAGIERIVLERKRISIHRKSLKPVKLNLDFLEKQQRKEAFEFFISFSKEKSIAIEKRFF